MVLPSISSEQAVQPVPALVTIEIAEPEVEIAAIALAGVDTTVRAGVRHAATPPRAWNPEPELTAELRSRKRR